MESFGDKKMMNPDNKKIILEEVNKHRGQIVLDYFQVVRLDGFAEDDDDYYYVYYTLDRGIVWSSCVGKFIPLKDYLPLRDYRMLKKIFNLNIKTRKEYEHNTNGKRTDA